MPMSKNIKDAILGNVTNVNKNKSILKKYFKISIFDVVDFIFNSPFLYRGKYNIYYIKRQDPSFEKEGPIDS